MATLTTQVIVRTGVAPSYVTPAGGGDACEVGDDIFLHVKNASGSPVTVTLAIPSSNSGYSGAVYTNTAVSVPATTGDRMIGPITAGLYKDPTTGLCTITTSAQTSVTIACIKLQEA
jgi:hypothetical protein